MYMLGIKLKVLPIIYHFRIDIVWHKPGSYHGPRIWNGPHLSGPYDDTPYELSFYEYYPLTKRVTVRSNNPQLIEHVFWLLICMLFKIN